MHSSCLLTLIKTVFCRAVGFTEYILYVPKSVLHFGGWMSSFSLYLYTTPPFLSAKRRISSFALQSWLWLMETGRETFLPNRPSSKRSSWAGCVIRTHRDNAEISSCELTCEINNRFTITYDVWHGVLEFNICMTLKKIKIQFFKWLVDHKSETTYFPT